MKLATYLPDGQDRPRIGVLHLHAGTEYLIDAVMAYTHVLRHIDKNPAAEELASASVPGDMRALLEAGEPALRAVRRGAEFAAGVLRTIDSAEALIEQSILHRLDTVRLLAPIPRPGKVVAIGANYHDHIAEGRQSGAIDRLPSYPPAFLKMSSGVIGPDESIVFPTLGNELDYEVEFSIVIGAYCKDVAPAQWLDVVAGFTVVNDLSLRDVILQEKDSGIVLVGKNFATSCPMGPYLVTKDELTTPDDLAITLRVNGIVRQLDRTSSMIHSCAAIVAYWSRLGLEPGDVITTGTPGGNAGFGRKHPDRLLKVGDVVEAEVEGIGILRNHVVAEPPRRVDASRVQGGVEDIAVPAVSA